MAIVFIGVLYSIVYSQTHFLLPLTLSGLFGQKGAEFFGLVISVNALTVVLMTLPITHMMRGRKPLLGIALTGLLYAVGFGLIPSLRTFIGFCISTVIWTMGEILVSMFSGVLTANYSPINLRGTFSSVSALSWSIGGAIGTFAAGKLFGILGSDGLWFSVGFLSLIAAGLSFALMFIEMRGKNRTSDPMDTA